MTASTGLRDRARAALLAQRTDAGHWEGRLSSSALSTATAVIALAECARSTHAAQRAAPGQPPREPQPHALDPAAAERLIRGGLHWLVATQNTDGGWGDTTASATNISTTALCWAAFGAVTPDEPARRSIGLAEAWLENAARGLAPRRLAQAIEARYGRDRTFSVPILTALAIAGRLGSDPWRTVRQLPFELAACPHQWFKWLRLPVVSYALPALIAIGHARHHARPTRNPITRAIRRRTRGRTLDVLTSIQPASGGFLEAVPLTSFVVMSLAACGQTDVEVVRRGVRFLVAGVREDGSWPIDTNLATWLTTLAVKALAPAGRRAAPLPSAQQQALVAWLLAQHYGEEHPYTHAAPGGWAWTDLPGGVPDADDTAGALLALRSLRADDPRAHAAVRAGVQWLLDLQNRDGGMPTFCRGWGHLPFDRSGADLTAHAVRAWLAWRSTVPDLQARIDAALGAAVEYLGREQRADGAWIPLWFGNERVDGECNPTYGTANVLPALHELSKQGQATAAALVESGARWLLAAQRADGGWGGDRQAVRASIEETALAVWSLAESGQDDETSRLAIGRGLAWLSAATDEGRRFDPSPIGFYFAKLWYSDALYPVIFTVAAAEAAAALGEPRTRRIMPEPTPRAIYMDNHATTPVDPRVLDAMLPYLRDQVGNAASLDHAPGRAARRAVEIARQQVADLIGASPRDIVFTSGATEADNLAIKGVVALARAARPDGQHIVTAATEHRAVLDTCRRLEREGVQVTYLPVDREGLVDLEDLRRALETPTRLVSLMAANNETGVLQPLAEIGRLVHAHGALFHSDGAQAAGKIPLHVQSQQLDLLSLSAHKLYGPQGIGALYVRSRQPTVRLAPLVDGGGHERGFRSGTLNTPGIVGFGAAAEICGREMTGEAARLGALRDHLLDGLRARLAGMHVNGSMTARLPHNLNVSIEGLDETLASQLVGLAVSAGSACSTTSIEPSHVLQAMGVPAHLAHGTLRFGLGRFNTDLEVDAAIAIVGATVERLRATAR